jgi:hypothetical protein
MKKNGKSAQPNTEKRGTPHAKASEPVNFKWSPQELKNLDKLGKKYLDIKFPFRKKLESCRRRGKKLQEYDLKHHKELHMMLAEIYEIYIAARGKGSLDRLWEELVPLCRLHNYKPTKASNYFLVMIRAFTRYDEKRASGYAMALRFVLDKGIEEDAVVEFFKNEMGVDKCAEEYSNLHPKKESKRRVKASSNKPVPPAPLEAHGNPVIKWGPKALSRFDKLRQEKKEAYLKVKFKEDGTPFVCRCSSSPINPNPAVKKAAKQRPSTSIH